MKTEQEQKRMYSNATITAGNVTVIPSYETQGNTVEVSLRIRITLKNNSIVEIFGSGHKFCVPFIFMRGADSKVGEYSIFCHSDRYELSDNDYDLIASTTKLTRKFLSLLVPVTEDEAKQINKYVQEVAQLFRCKVSV